MPDRPDLDDLLIDLTLQMEDYLLPANAPDPRVKPLLITALDIIDTLLAAPE